MAEFGGLQLLPETRKRFDVSVPGANKYFYAGLVVLLLSVGLYLGIRFYGQALQEDLDNLDSDLIALENQRDKPNEERLKTFSSQSALMANLLKNHVFWTQALAKLQALTHSQVQIRTLSASLSKKEIIINATAANYATIARQIAAFSSDDAIVDVSVGDMRSLPSGRIEFSVPLKFNEAKLLKKP